MFKHHFSSKFHSFTTQDTFDRSRDTLAYIFMRYFSVRRGWSGPRGSFNWQVVQSAGCVLACGTPTALSGVLNFWYKKNTFFLISKKNDKEKSNCKLLDIKKQQVAVLNIFFYKNKKRKTTKKKPNFINFFSVNSLIFTF